MKNQRFNSTTLGLRLLSSLGGELKNHLIPTPLFVLALCKDTLCKDKYASREKSLTVGINELWHLAIKVTNFSKKLVEKHQMKKRSYPIGDNQYQQLLRRSMLAQAFLAKRLWLVKVTRFR
jgi:hypothetical protein